MHQLLLVLGRCVHRPQQLVQSTRPLQRLCRHVDSSVQSDCCSNGTTRASNGVTSPTVVCATAISFGRPNLAHTSSDAFACYATNARSSNLQRMLLLLGGRVLGTH